jgi:hypothetical protein
MKTFFINCFLVTIVWGFSINLYSQPLPPTNLTATEVNVLSGTGVKLSWQGSGNNMIRYNIYCKEGGLNDPGDFELKYPGIRHQSFVDWMIIAGETYSYYVTAINSQGESDPSNIVAITLSGSASTGIITGILTDESNNQPIEGGKVYFVSANIHHHGFVATTNDAGEFYANLNAGDYYIRSSAMGYVPEFYDNAPTIFEATLVALNEEDSLHFDISLTPYVPPVLYTLSGSVTDEIGNPLRARLWIISVRSNSYILHHHIRSVMTDSLGNYSASVRENDTVIVYCRPLNFNYLPEYYDDKQTFADADRIYISGDIAGIDFELAQRPVFNNGISGMVRNTDNEGVFSHIAAFNLNINHHRKYSTQTDSLGNYLLSNLIPGEYILLAVPQFGYSPTFFRYDGTPTLNRHEADSVVVSEEGVVNDINFTVHPFQTEGYARVTGTVKNESGEAIYGAIVFAVDEELNVYSYAISDVSGRFVIEGFIPGNYTLIADKFGYSSEASLNVQLDYLVNLSADVNFILTSDTPTYLDNKSEIIPSEYQLYQNYPNPFNPATAIKYSIPERTNVKIILYNILGSEILELENGLRDAGTYTINLNADNIPSGVYLYRLETNSFTATKKLIILK